MIRIQGSIITYTMTLKLYNSFWVIGNDEFDLHLPRICYWPFIIPFNFLNFILIVLFVFIVHWTQDLFFYHLQRARKDQGTHLILVCTLNIKVLDYLDANSFHVDNGILVRHVWYTFYCPLSILRYCCLVMSEIEWMKMSCIIHV